MNKEYPNLQLLEYISEQEVFEKYKEVLNDSKYLTFRAQVFIQSWPNTATGFDLKGGCSGQAFTDEYTTVFEIGWYMLDENKKWKEVDDRIYTVFFGNRLAYSFLNPNKTFHDHLYVQQMGSQKQALGWYK